MALIIKTSGFDEYLSGGAYIKALVMGPPGAGKTRSAAFWPKPIFADCEDGMMSVADLARPFVDINSDVDMNELLAMLKTECAKGADRRFQTLVIDTIDNYQRRITQQRLNTLQKLALSGFEDWGWLDAKMTNLLEKLQNLPMHIVVNLHVKETQEDTPDGRKATVVGPKLRGDIKDQIAGEFDLVGYMSTQWAAEGGQRSLIRNIRWSPDPRVPILKDRSGRLPETTKIDFSEEDFQRIYTSIVGDHIEDIPSTTVVEEVQLTPAPATPAPPDDKGGQIAQAKDIPGGKGNAAKKTAAKKAAKKKPETPAPDVPVEVDEKGDATPEPTAREEPTTTTGATTDVDTQDAEAPAHEEAVATAAEALGGEVVSEIASADDSPAEPAEKPLPTTPAEANCGDQPPHFIGKKAPVPGCGKPLAEEVKDERKRGLIDLAQLKLGTWLCADDYMAWKERN